MLEQAVAAVHCPALDARLGQVALVGDAHAVPEPPFRRSRPRTPPAPCTSPHSARGVPTCRSCASTGRWPTAAWIAQQVQRFVELVGTAIEQPQPVARQNRARLANQSLLDQSARLAVARLKATLVPHGQLGAGLVAGGDHVVGLAHRGAHRLFAKDALHSRLGRGDGDLCAHALPRRDAQDVQALPWPASGDSRRRASRRRRSRTCPGPRGLCPPRPPGWFAGTLCTTWRDSCPCRRTRRCPRDRPCPCHPPCCISAPMRGAVQRQPCLPKGTCAKNSKALRPLKACGPGKTSVHRQLGRARGLE